MEEDLLLIEEESLLLMEEEEVGLLADKLLLLEQDFLFLEDFFLSKRLTPPTSALGLPWRHKKNRNPPMWL